jgi:hypothetical protein
MVVTTLLLEEAEGEEGERPLTGVCTLLESGEVAREVDVGV